MSAGTVAALTEGGALSPTALIEAFIIDGSPIGGTPLYLTNQSLPDGTDLVWQGQTYTRYPIKVTGFEFVNKGTLPRPRITLSNIFGTFTALNINYQDMTRALFIRKRFYYKHLIASPQPVAGGYPDDIYTFSRKISQNRLQVEYECSSALEIDGLQLPNEQVFANLCRWKYRSPECTYSGPPIANRGGDLPAHVAVTARGIWAPGATYNTGDYVKKGLEIDYLGITRYRFYIAQVNGITGAATEPPNTAYWFEDECSKRVSDGCKFRFGPTKALPFGGFPGTARLPDASAG